MAKIIMITGGQRSGKSSFAERMALELTEGCKQGPVYLATARIWDKEFALRVERHKARRGERWTNLECEKYLSECNLQGRVVVIDCVTLWATNFFFDLSAAAESAEAADAADGSVVERVLGLMKRELHKLAKLEATLIFVTNEIGLGGVSENKLQRQFTDIEGWFNQHLAEYADDVYLMVSGIPVKIK